MLSEENYVSMIENKTLSPNSLRRSTRVSAIKAAERLRGEQRSDEVDGVIEDDDSLPLSILKEDSQLVKNMSPPPIKKRRLADTATLDPTDPHFAIQMTENGEVVVLSDDSEVSSLNEEEIDFIKKDYAKIVCKELTELQRKEQERIINRLKSELLAEEAKLILLKKMRHSQLCAARELQPVHQQKAIPAGLQPPPLHKGTTAYRPPLAAPPTATAQRNGHHANAHHGFSANTQNRGPGRPPVISGESRGGSLHSQQLGKTNTYQPSTAKLSAAATSSVQPAKVAQPQTVAASAVPSRPVVHDTQTPEQKQAAAKLALRKQLEKTLLQIPPPRPPPPEMHFVPNPNQPDFVCLLGLDYVVQRLLDAKERKERIKEEKEKAKEEKENVGRAENSAESQGAASEEKSAASAAPERPSRSSEKPMKEPFGCAQCKVDYTPVWKQDAQGRIMCEQCVRTNQKKSLKAEHTNRLKQAFVKALQQEQEIEQQIQAGSFCAAAATTAAASSSAQLSSTVAPTHLVKQAAPVLPSTPAGSASSQANAASNSSTFRKAMANLASASQPQIQLPPGLAAFPQLLGWNPLLAAGVRFPPISSAAGVLPPGLQAALPNLTGVSSDLLKQMQQQSVQQQAALQRKALMDMLPKQHFQNR